MQIHQSAEDYLECILKLSKELPVVRSIDIANEMNYSKPSISVATVSYTHLTLPTTERV